MAWLCRALQELPTESIGCILELNGLQGGSQACQPPALHCRLSADDCSAALLQAAASSRAGESITLQDRMLHVCRSRATAALKESHANFGCFREPNDLPGSPEPTPVGSPSATSQKSLASRSFSSVRG